MSTTTGIGYDSHRLVPGRRLVIGGVELEHELGLEGHSDADVLTHAVIDAVLGACALGDIGEHFPDTDPRFAGADSIELLRTAVTRVQEAGFEVLHVDATVVIERPKLSPVREQIRARPRRGARSRPPARERQGDSRRGNGFRGARGGSRGDRGRDRGDARLRAAGRHGPTCAGPDTRAVTAPTSRGRATPATARSDGRRRGSLGKPPVPVRAPADDAEHAAVPVALQQLRRRLDAGHGRGRRRPHRHERIGRHPVEVAAATGAIDDLPKALQRAGEKKTLT